MDQGEARVGPIHAGDIIRDAFAVCGRHAAVLFGVSIVIQTAVLVVSFVALNTLGAVGILVWVLLTLASYQVSMGIYTLFLLHLRHGHEVPSATYLLKEAAPFALPLCWLGIVSSIGVGIGFLFLIIPGIILSLRWAVAPPALVAKRVGTMDALKISGELTKDAYGTIFVLGSIQGLITNLIPQLLTASATTPTENVLLIQGVFAAIATPVAALSSAELFLRLARVPDRIAPGSALFGGPTPAPGGPGALVAPGAPIAPLAPPLDYGTAALQALAAPATPPYAAAPQPYAAAPQPYAPAPQPYAAPPPPQPGPPAVSRGESIGPPGMA